ncbi:putative protein-serine/threonine phosphatase [Lupinus albus]|uniref:Protein phosphatase n=1 Tax=Lupinus albus TaxID=3870 RepID=A0A6A4PYE8_LUPAL|nr:putative protein-serine/threonine phosphatase [Lupinus albus]
MLSGIVSKLNATIYCGIPETVTRQQRVPTSLYRNSVLSLSSLNSTHSSSHHTKSMTTSASNAVLGDVYVDDLASSCGNVLDLTRPAGVYFKDRTRKGCLRASVILRRSQLFYGTLFEGSTFDAANWRNRNSTFLRGPLSRKFSTSSSAGTAHDISAEGSTPDQTIAGRKVLKMISGSSYLPHPAKEETGGEDAHFICSDEQAIGVADGVGGWADVGVNAGLFAQELISNSVTAVQEEPKGSFNPARVLEKAHSKTKAKGSSTACIVALTDEGLQAINLGDSGFIVVRDGRTIFRSPVQLHGFNFTFQLESGNGGDLPSSGEVFTLPVAPGDVVIAGTDGLFDNLYNNEISAVVVNAVKDGLEPQATAQKIAAMARHRALDRNKLTPFSIAAQEAGFRYIGGKLDDITVVVSYITSFTSE